MPKDTKRMLQKRIDISESTWRKVGIAFLLLLIGWYFIVYIPRGSDYDGDGSISVFPDTNSVKNYRLEATIEVKTGAKSIITNRKEYIVESAVWPDGGTLSFKGICAAPGLNQGTTCSAKDGRSYYIEVTEAPTPPDPETTSN